MPYKLNKSSSFFCADTNELLLLPRMVDDLHRLLEAAQIATPFILVGSELGALNGRFYSHIHDV